MRFYVTAVGSAYEALATLGHVVGRLRGMGHDVDRPRRHDKPGWRMHDGDLRADLAMLADADALVILTGQGVHLGGRSEATLELGVALGRALDVILVGAPIGPFTLATLRLSTEADLFDWLRSVASPSTDAVPSDPPFVPTP